MKNYHIMIKRPDVTKPLGIDQRVWIQEIDDSQSIRPVVQIMERLNEQYPDEKMSSGEWRQWTWEVYEIGQKGNSNLKLCLRREFDGVS